MSFPSLHFILMLDKLCYVHREAYRELSLNSNYLPLFFFFQGVIFYFFAKASIQMEKK